MNRAFTGFSGLEAKVVKDIQQICEANNLSLIQVLGISSFMEYSTRISMLSHIDDKDKIEMLSKSLGEFLDKIEKDPMLAQLGSYGKAKAIIDFLENKK